MYKDQALLFDTEPDAFLYLDFLGDGNAVKAYDLYLGRHMAPVGKPLTGTLLKFTPDPGPSKIKLDVPAELKGYAISVECYVFNMQIEAVSH